MKLVLYSEFTIVISFSRSSVKEEKKTIFYSTPKIVSALSVKKEKKSESKIQKTPFKMPAKVDFRGESRGKGP